MCKVAYVPCQSARGSAGHAEFAVGLMARSAQLRNLQIGEVACPGYGSRRGRRSGHAVVLEKVLASQGDQLAVSRMVNHFVTDYAERGVWPMLLGIATKVGGCRVRASHQHLGDAVEYIADFAEELVLGPHGAAVLCSVVSVCPNLLRL